MADPPVPGSIDRVHMGPRFGEPGAHKITHSPYDVIYDLGDDSRKAVADPNQFPFRHIALLHAFDSKNMLRNAGTAFLMGPGLAATAAHVVQNVQAFAGEPGFRAHRLQLWFGFSSGLNAGVFVRTGRFQVYPDYDPTTGKGIDAAVIGIGGAVASDWTGVRPTGHASELTDYNLAGFPSEKPAGGLTMMHASSQKAGVRSGRLFHTIDSSEGQSGAPVWWQDGSDVRIAAIHNEGTSATFQAGFLANGAVLLTKALTDWMSGSDVAGSA